MKAQQKIIGNQKGFTLLEVMIVMAITVVAILAIIQANVAIQKNSEAYFEKVAAMQHAQRLVEQIRVTASTAGGVFPSNTVNNYPNNTVYNVNSPSYQWLVLPLETMTLSYADPAAVPLDATVTVGWLNGQNRNTTATLRTLIAKRT